MNMVVSEQIKNAPDKSGVYIFKYNNSPIYVGKASSLKKRLQSYGKLDMNSAAKTVSMIEIATNLEYIITASELDALILESQMIKQLKPKYNIKLKDGKGYVYLRITKEEFPRVLVANKKVDNGDTYYGPFTESTPLRSLLKEFRYIFKWCLEKKKSGKPCFYFHLGLCSGSCAKKISKEDYIKDIKLLEKIFKGKRVDLLKDLESQMLKASNAQKFESAALIRDKIKRIISASEHFHFQSLSDLNFLLPSDVIDTELSELHKIIQTEFPEVEVLKRIECYDMAQFQSSHIVGGMIVFEDGLKSSDNFRKFHIRGQNIKSDTDAMKEVLNRRLTNLIHNKLGFEVIPDLIIVDGGKAQVNIISELLKYLQLSIPLIGIAKQQEVFVFPSGKVVKKDLSNPAVMLVRRMRDETHRYTNSFHVKTRLKAFLPNSK